MDSPRYVTARPLWGSYETRPIGPLALKRVWEHNPRLRLSRQEQLQQNRANHPDFSEVQYLQPAGEVGCHA